MDNDRPVVLTRIMSLIVKIRGYGRVSGYISELVHETIEARDGVLRGAQPHL